MSHNKVTRTNNEHLANSVLRILFIAVGAFLGMFAGAPLLLKENEIGFLTIFPGAVVGGLSFRLLQALTRTKTTVRTAAFPWMILAGLAIAAIAAICIAHISKGHAVVMIITIVCLSIVAGYYAAGDGQATNSA